MIDEIFAHGAAAYPHEACGLLVIVGKKVRVRLCRNINPEPRQRFTLAPEDYAAAADLGELVGAWHTHPDRAAYPSEADRAGCNASGLPYTIVSVIRQDGQLVNGGAHQLEPSDEPVPLIGRPYLYGIYDCYTIVRDYFRQEMGIVLSDYSHAPENWWKHGGNWFAENFESEGFVALPAGTPPRKHDLFFLQINAPKPNHAGIYLGDDIMLHHCNERLSRRDIYGGMWAKHTVIHTRHKDAPC
jgi:proteasome lid subunit RPN8/RPN11